MHKNGLASTKTIKKQDIILIFIFLCLALVGSIWLRCFSKPGNQVRVFVDGRITEAYSLVENRQVVIQGVGGSNSFCIRDGYVDMTEADCRDKICVKHKKIHRSGETIVCLPHKVVLEIVSGEQDSPEKEYDIMAQ